MYGDALALRCEIGRGRRLNVGPDAIHSIAITMMRDGMPLERKLELASAAGLPDPVTSFLRRHSASPLAVLEVSIAVQHVRGDVPDSTWLELLTRLRFAS